jgi:hypothetical protein
MKQTEFAYWWMINTNHIMDGWRHERYSLTGETHLSERGAEPWRARQVSASGEIISSHFRYLLETIRFFSRVRAYRCPTLTETRYLEIQITVDEWTGNYGRPSPTGQENGTQ